MVAILTRLAGPSNLPTTAATGYDPPVAGAVLREIGLVNTTGAAITVSISVGTLADATLIFKASVPANTTYVQGRNVPLLDANIVQWVASATGVTCTLSGATL